MESSSGAGCIDAVFFLAMADHVPVLEGSKLLLDKRIKCQEIQCSEESVVRKVKWMVCACTTNDKYDSHVRSDTC